jgi:hypothetical protein
MAARWLGDKTRVLEDTLPSEKGVAIQESWEQAMLKELSWPPISTEIARASANLFAS